MQVLIVLKYGGHAMASGAADSVLDECASRWAAGDQIVLVHGGGPQIDAALLARGIEERRVAGLRVTSEEAVGVVEAVLCGTVNKALVRALSARGVATVGISGEDGQTLRARRMILASGEALGLVGEIVAVRDALLRLLLDARFFPIVAPIALGDAPDTTVLNVNADSAAGAIAGALGADLYVNVTNVSRVRLRSDDPQSEVSTMTCAEALRGIAGGALEGGIVPKVRSAIDALAAGARRAVICGATSAPITAALTGGGTELFA